MKLRKLTLVFIFLLIIIAQSGYCFDWYYARQIKEGMTVDEVTYLMGKPYRITSTKDIVRYVWVDVSFWTGATKSLSIAFKDGKVAEAPTIPDNFK